MIARDQALDRFPAVYDRVRTRRPGMLDRPPQWWEWLLWDPKEERGGWSPHFHVVHQGRQGDDGYVTYRVKESWSHRGADNVVEVIELVTASDAAYDALWRYVLDLDLTGVVEGWRRPADEPLPHMLAEPRRLSFGLRDGIWVRVVDVRRALEARRYPVEGRVVLEVRDTACPWNEGRHLLEGGPQGAACRPTDEEPDVVMGAEDLGAAYLGGTALSSLARAGRVVEASPNAALADAMFAWHPLPWSPHVF
jgi:predicted acetyltransferase